MQLSLRLQAVAELVTPGRRAADIGCDHAYIPIYLAENKISPHIIAMDVNQGPVNRAEKNIRKYGCKDLIETRKSDGLTELKPGEADSIIIAGMGGALTCQILTNRLEVAKAAGELILQPQSEVHKVRQMLKDLNFLIIRENMVKEDGKYYVMMKAVPEGFMKDAGAYDLSKKEHFYYGRLLLEGRQPVLKEFLTWDLGICLNILQSLENEKTNNALGRQEEIRDKMGLINCALGYYYNNRQEEI